MTKEPTAYEQGKALSEELNPGTEAALAHRFDKLVPGMSQSFIEVAYGHFLSREVVDKKTRFLAAIAALTTIGGQTSPQLRVNIKAARKYGASREEICEIIFQMTLYGGISSMFSAMNAALEVFEEEDK